ncbi:DEAD/DEAH box helicase family protein [Sulfitobacter sp. JBTF-M27]|uniref:DEAD/DEAH box helicase family protein n=1 Tax=Sulfitobacter sediminilitoris TaxID=2698830 RepID=A0A6P0CGG6_9RHOB|nr:DEAD/DEAH box helicase family protein [Sulfitobacter sediminilitoris]NEK23564.1 DEAD/DEAH box helicase family protein [Sulfitobacter sediminilitoris]
MTTINLRPWQADCANKAMDWLQAGEDRHFLINAAPGAGKTICASVIAQRLFDAKMIDRVIVIAPRTTVVNQWADEFKFVTGRAMLKITGADDDPENYGVDLCATWSAIQSSLDGLQAVCRKDRTLVICDEHHHAAVEAAWGDGANGAFADAQFTLILTGTPIRSDGKESVWLAYDDQGLIDHPEGGTYTLTYGEAVDLDYCRPITFHRHEGKFSVKLDDGENISVSGTEETQFSAGLKRIRGLQQALDYYKLACTPKYLPSGAADTNSYQASMLEWCIEKLNDLRLRMPEAAGLIIAPNIPVAEYMADLLELLDGEKPVLVHNRVSNPEGKIAAFRNSKKRWIVSVAMISEGVDIQRLRVLAYLPNAQTELYFRQAMGRVVRNFGPQDDSRAYVVMPTHRVFEEYARRVEAEMSPAKLRPSDTPDTKVCPDCGAECPKDETSCQICDAEFPVRGPRMKTCEACGSLNTLGAKDCQSCGEAFGHDFEISLNDALRVGAIIRGMDLDEEEVQEGEAVRDVFRKGVLSSGDDQLIKILKHLPEESYGRLARMFENNQ